MSESSVMLVEVEGSSTVKAVAGMRKVLLPGFRGCIDVIATWFESEL